MRGREDLLSVPKWTDSTCQTVDFPPYRFYPDKQVHIQVTVNHMKANDSVTVHDAVTSWTENVNTKNFTVCVLQAGRRSGANLNPFADSSYSHSLGGLAFLLKCNYDVKSLDSNIPPFYRELLRFFPRNEQQMRK